ncbi:MAG: hypothetical protein HRT44_14255 [Bdellovibrionales bacterium]|nr:hypothetical protein [Bdellovibrionales bacterium]NQZ20401.1 hypothetical protein [Bdellovibrionales bacterium]
MSQWVLKCEKRHWAYSMELDKYKIPMGEGESHSEKVLKALAVYGESHD